MTKQNPDWHTYALAVASSLRLGPTDSDRALWTLTDARLTACRKAEGQPRGAVWRIQAGRLARLERRGYRRAGYRWAGKLGGMVNPRLR